MGRHTSKLLWEQPWASKVCLISSKDPGIEIKLSSHMWLRTSAAENFCRGY